MQNDELIAKLQPSSSKCIRLDEEKTPQQKLSMEALLKRREELKDRVKKAKQEAVNLRNIETNMVEICELEDYKKKVEERARRDVEDKVEKVNSLLQVNFLIYCALIHFTANYLLDKYSVFVFPLLPLIAIYYVDFRKEGVICFSFQYFSFYPYYHKIDLSK